MPPKIAIVVDSSCGLSQSEGEKLDLVVQPLLIAKNADQAYRDGVDIDSARLYELLKGDDKISTSQVSPGESLALAEKLLKDHEQVLCIPISSGLSSSYGTWKTLESELKPNQLHVIDAKNIAYGCVDLALNVKRLADSGANFAQIDAHAEAYCQNTYALLVCNDFQRLVKGGRMGVFKGAVATMLKLHVLIEFANGKLTFKDKSRDLKKLTASLTGEIFAKLKIENKEQINHASLLHTFPNEADKKLLQITQEVKSTMPEGASLRVSPLPAVIACHVGLNSFALLINKKSPA